MLMSSSSQAWFEICLGVVSELLLVSEKPITYIGADSPYDRSSNVPLISLCRMLELVFCTSHVDYWLYINVVLTRLSARPFYSPTHDTPSGS